MGSSIVLTPGGRYPAEKVHHISADTRLSFRRRDLFEIVARMSGPPPVPPRRLPRATPGDPAVAHPQFTSTWTVPAAPKVDRGQTIFVFDAIQRSPTIYQPVLQWGPSAAGGSDRWSVASWYSDAASGHTFYSDLVDVEPGDVLVGVMTMTGFRPAPVGGTLYSYYCEVRGVHATGLPVEVLEELAWE